MTYIMSHLDQPISLHAAPGPSTPTVKTHLIRLHGPVLHVQVPHFDREVVPGHHVASAVAELDVRDGGDDLREKGPAARVLRLLKD